MPPAELGLLEFLLKVFVAYLIGSLLGSLIIGKLRGGKGAATLIGVVLGLNALAAIPTLCVWFGVLLLTGYVGLATMIATAFFPLYALLVAKSEVLLIFGAAMTLFVVFTHRENIVR